MKSYKVMVRATGESTFASNGLRFATKEEAESYAKDLFMRWFAVEEYRVDESEDKVSHAWFDGQVVPVGPRTLRAIAREIRKDWQKVYFGAVPYLQAMSTLESITDSYGMDSAESIVLYFLSNASTWRGETAKRIKAELKAMLKK